jgi:hypothetical protein
LRAQVSRRLAVPELRTLEAGRSVMLENLRKLRRLHQLRERPGVENELRKAQVADDFGAQEELLRRLKDAARARHKLD